jgi:septal ring factor EnvC (AmiA/AmiB activator)
METGTWLGIGALIISAAGAINSLRKESRDDRSATHGELQSLNKIYREEIERLKTEIRESEEECRRQIASCNERLIAQQDHLDALRGTIVQQANQIVKLEMRQRERLDRDGDG